MQINSETKKGILSLLSTSATAPLDIGKVCFSFWGIFITMVNCGEGKKLTKMEGWFKTIVLTYNAISSLLETYDTVAFFKYYLYSSSDFFFFFLHEFVVQIHLMMPMDTSSIMFLESSGVSGLLTSYTLLQATQPGLIRLQLVSR